MAFLDAIYHKVVLRVLCDNTGSTVSVSILEILKEETAIKHFSISASVKSTKHILELNKFHESSDATTYIENLILFIEDVT
jgi:hypothetical protein